ncbi:T9SS type A sorting domain-containing protein [Flavobacterium franklandianum]|uniref:SdiA-regulated domain-containing protein n=1 Tax=Flavobacterium franklandianum TaxID=2594430 RepID=UPI00117B98B4|nr:SdiA-regulated domain-containing protein [Flavobacterium franklandianum]TRX29196.1 T9SS type A sorting domain-containing protein [Flavobacterium franklandianum]
MKHFLQLKLENFSDSPNFVLAQQSRLLDEAGPVNQNGLELNSKSLVKEKKTNLGFVFFFTLMFSLFGFVQNAISQTTLVVGDLSIIGFQLNSPDSFAFTSWVDIAPNTYIKFTDNAFLSAGSATATGNIRGGENFVIWKSSVLTPAGTVITITDNTTASTNNGTIISGNLSGLSASGDNIFAYQGTATSGANPDFSANTNPTTFNGTLLFGLFGQGTSAVTSWLTTGTASSNTSYLPSQLNVANGNIVLASSSTRGQYTGSRNNQTTLADYKAMVNNVANWTTATSAGVITLNTTAFTASAPSNPSVTLSTSVNTGTEAGTTTITVTATANAAVSGDQTVNLDVSGTNITAGDYALSNSVITILNGQTMGFVTFTVIDDALVESAETATLTISNPSSGILLGTTSTQNITITDNDVATNPTVSLSVNANDGSEAGITTITVTATADIAVAGDQTIDLGVTGTNITAGDYALSNSVITILNGQTTGSVTFTVIDDALVESAETAILTISNPSSGIVIGATSTQNIVIADNDVAVLPTVLLSTSANAGTEAGTTVITVIATSDSAVAGDQTINLGVSGTNITAGDYVLSNSVITISNGQTTGSVTFTVVDDVLFEGEETATLTISNPSSGIALGVTTIQNISITDNDVAPPPTVQLSASANTGTEAGATIITVTATASAAVSGDQTLNLAVTGTGITGADYSLSNTQITILSGSTTGMVTFTIVDDAADEGTETATLTISNPSEGFTLGATIAQNITITDNDAPPVTTLAAGDISVIGYNLSGTPNDNFAILVHKDLSARTIFYINDNEIATAGTSTFTDLNEAEISFTVKAGQIIPKGTVILIPWGVAAVSTSTYDLTSSSGAGLGASGDELYIYNASSITATTATSFICFAKIGNSPSAVPAGLISGTTSINPSLVPGSRYKISGALYNACQADLLAAIGNTASNWQAVAPGAASDWTFTVLPACAPVLPTVTLSVNANTATEVGTTTITVTATANAAVSEDQTLNLGISGINITAGDYALSNSVITIVNGQTTGSVTFTVIDDALVEGSEIAALAISNPSSGITLGTTTTQDITITDNDVAVVPTVLLSVSANTGTEVGTTVITVTATAESAVAGDQTIDLGVTGINITAGDYALSNSVITISNGQTTGSVTFTVIDDALVESAETAILTISNPSSGIVIGATSTQSVAITDNDAALNIDLSTYVRVGRYNLPEPTRTAAPSNNLLCQEASAVTYNWDTDTLFITADGSTSVTQVSKTGQLIDTMTMAQGSSPQGTDFYDTEGITYVGNGQFVMSEERDRQLVKFTYAAGTTLTRSNTQTVKIGTFVPNTGTEGLSYDPLTGGYIVLKEITPIGIFQTGVDFTAGIATNGSATTENSTNLFDPALLGFSDVADVFALSNLPSLNGQSLYNNLLVLGQENAKVVNIDRNGVIANSLTIVSDAGNPLDVASQQHEGLTVDRNGILYIVSENGGGDIDHPQLWVYAPSTVPNQAPTVVALTNTTNAILENSNTTVAVKVSNIMVTDDGLGTNNLSLTGTDANFFQITGSSLFIKAGTVLDFETKTSYNVSVNVDDTTLGATPDASINYVLNVTDVAVETPQVVSVSISEVASWSSSNALVVADWFEVTNNGTTALDITGWKVDDSSNLFTSALALNGITSIAPGESVIFLETSSTNSATIIANFKSAWFGTNVPSGLQVGYYTGTGIGLSSSSDAVNLYDASGALMSKVTFGTATTNYTFNNAIGLNNTAITILSQIGVNDAFAAVNDAVQIGSPGSVGKLFISEVAPWSSSNSPIGVDWFEVTNTKAVAIDITGWKMDDNSQSPAGAVALNGITSINPGESVLFMETSDLAGKTTAFLNNWFGTNPSSGIRIGNYTGSGVGLSSGGDQVNLYNATSSTPQASVLFGASPTTTFATFDNSAGLNNITTAITQMSAVGIKGAFIAANSAVEIGSPGTILTAPCPTITATATPVSASVCTGATTTVSVTATGGTLPYTVSGSSLTVGVGTFNYTITDAKGCTATTSVTITNQPLTDNITPITACDSYTWNDITYTESGLYEGATTNCVTDKLNLTIVPSTLTLQPTNPTICKSIGAVATVLVSAASGSTFKWYSQAATGTTWSALANNTNYSGVDGTTLTITRTTTAIPATGTKYRAVISNSCGDMPSEIVVLQELTVLSKVAAISAKSNSNTILSPALTTCSGNTVNLTLAAGSIGNIQWQMSTTSATTGFADFGISIAQSAVSAVNPMITVSSGGLTQDTWFRVVASNSSCSSVIGLATKISVSAPAVAGTISGGNVTVCGFAASALNLTGTLVPFNNSTELNLIGNTGTIVWQKSTNYNASSPTWSAEGSTASTLIIANLTADTWYRAQVTSGVCKVFTDVVKITISKVAKTGTTTATANGVVTTSVCTGGDITFTSATFTGTSIQWEVSITSSTTGFATIEGANASSFTMTNVTYAPLSKFYVRSVVTSGDCTIARSAIKTITVNPISVAGSITGGGILCSGGGSTVKVLGNTGTIQWLYSTNGIVYANVPSMLLPNALAGFETSSTGIASTYVFTNFTAGTVYFKAKIKSGACSETFTNVVEYNIGTTAVSGVVSALSSTICPATGTTLTLSNSVGFVQWQKALISVTTGLPGTFSNIKNQIETTLATGNLTASTAYQAVITIGTCSTIITNYTVVNVLAKPIAKSITSNVTSPLGGLTTPLCTNDPKKTLTIGAGYAGAIQWQSSNVSTNKGFADIDGATSASYTIANPSVGANYYRATFTNTCGVIAISAPVTIYFTNCSNSARVAETKDEVEMTFNVFAYPNPFRDNFKLSLESPSNEKVNVAVFDLSGKLIELREINSNEINTLDLGNNYPSGVFNVIVTQGTYTKTVRVIKQ